MKRKILLIASFFVISHLSAQIVDIPDENFKNALIDSNVIDTTGNGLGDSVADTNGDGEIQLSEAEAVFGLIISYHEVSSLEGIQSFTNLRVLKSRGNFVETIDLSQNLQLEWLHLSTNPLISIDLSHNINLQRLFVYNNLLTTLDVSQNINLVDLRCYTNQLTSLNISNENNMILDNFLTYENPLLNCIEVDNIEFANSQTQWQIDDFAFYSENCLFSINDFEKESFLIFPNPTKNILNFNYDFKGKTVRVLNMEGVVLKNTSTFNQIDISELPSGIYFLKFNSEEKILTKKIIKL